MTLSELLEKLKVVDPEIELEISDITLNLDQWSKPYEADIIQGCIQRAIERREWDLRQDQWIIKQDGPNGVHHYATIEKGIAETGEPFEYEGRGKSQAEAILAAYVAVKEEK